MSEQKQIWRTVFFSAVTSSSKIKTIIFKKAQGFILKIRYLLGLLISFIQALGQAVEDKLTIWNTKHVYEHMNNSIIPILA